jgi:predicted transcriptional regulator
MTNKLKAHLIEIANKVTDQTSLEDIYLQLALLTDIDESEEQEAKGEVLSHDEVKAKSEQWLK